MVASPPPPPPCCSCVCGGYKSGHPNQTCIHGGTDGLCLQSSWAPAKACFAILQRGLSKHEQAAVTHDGGLIHMYTNHAAGNRGRGLPTTIPTPHSLHHDHKHAPVSEKGCNNIGKVPLPAISFPHLTKSSYVRKGCIFSGC